jgi:glycosyltransferase involved in cell wall biosynthesis
MRILVTVSNDLVTDQRVSRVCHSLVARGHQVLLIGRKLPQSPDLPANLPYATRRIRLPFHRGAAFYASLNIALFFHMLFRRCDALHANDLDTLLPAWLVATLRRKQLVYDTHEYFTGVPELQQRPRVRHVWERIEAALFPRLRHIITVNESIAELYRRQYQVPHIAVMRNIPPAKVVVEAHSDDLAQLPDGVFRIILQGNGINVDRGAEEALEMMAHLPGAVLVIAGHGDVIPQLRQRAQAEPFRSRVVFFPRLPYNRLMGITAACHLGLTLDKDTNINYRFSLPNKLFDYLRAGIPVLASDLPEVRRIVETHHTGWLVPSVEPHVLAEKVQHIMAHPEAYQTLRSALPKASEALNWEHESRVLDAFYGPPHS